MKLEPSKRPWPVICYPERESEHKLVDRDGFITPATRQRECSPQ